MTDGAFDRAVTWIADVSGFFVAFMVLSVCADVVMRYIFGSPLGWTVEITEYLQLYLTFFAATAVLKEGGQASLDLVIVRTGPRVRRLLRFVADLVGVLTNGVILVFSSVLAYQAFVEGTPAIKSLEVPRWLILAPLPIGCLLLTVQFARRLLGSKREG